MTGEPGSAEPVPTASAPEDSPDAPSSDGADGAADPELSTLRAPSAWALLFGTIAFGLVTDLVSKYLAFGNVADQPVTIRRADVLAADRLSNLIPPHSPVEVVPSVLQFTLVLNPGAVFGIGAGQRWIFIIFTLVALAVAMYLFARWTRASDRIAHVSIGLLIAGGLGNLYDRLAYACVRDFLHFLPGVKLPFGLAWPGSGARDVWPWVSNVADAWLILGIGVLLILSWRQPHETRGGDSDTESNTVSDAAKPNP